VVVVAVFFGRDGTEASAMFCSLSSAEALFSHSGIDSRFHAVSQILSHLTRSLQKLMKWEMWHWKCGLESCT